MLSLSIWGLKVSKYFKNVLLVFLIVLMLFLTGCGNPMPTDDELYFVGWILHNINDTTPTDLEVNEGDYGEYRFVNNIPGYSPENYVGHFFFIAPSQGIAAAANVQFALPMTHTAYAYVSNPASENYKGNFSLDRGVSINYLRGFDRRSQFAYDISTDEMISERARESINPKSGEIKEFSFGGPYVPASVMVEYNNLGLRGELLQGKNSYVIGDSEMVLRDLFTGEEFTAELEKPEYRVYEDGVKMKEEGIVNSYGEWNKNYVYYYVQGNKNYIVNMTIPSYYETFNKTTVIAEFSTFNEVNLPWLNALNVSSGFKEGENLEVNVGAVNASNVEVYFRDGSDVWQEALFKGGDFGLTPGEGEGDLSGFVPISTCQELQDMKDNTSIDYKLTKDIDCSNTIDWNDGAGFDPIPRFTGLFDGQGYSIKGLYIHLLEQRGVGLFSRIADPGKIKNVNLVGVDITGRNWVGGLTGSASGDNARPIKDMVYITNVSVTGRVRGTSENVGGLIGSMDDAIVESCYADVEVIGTIGVGGLIGEAESDDMDMEIRNCYARGDVTGNLSRIGGLIGVSEVDIIENSYATGSVTGPLDVGGLVGFALLRGIISNSFSTGNVVSGSNAGGLIGRAEDTTVINSYYNNHLGNPGDCVGAIEDSVIDCISIDDNESYFYSSLNQPMFEWDFEGVWNVGEGGVFEFSPVGEEVDLKIVLIDDLGNSQTYIIEPVSLKERNLVMELFQDVDVISPGTVVNINGTVKDISGRVASNLLIDVYYNGESIGQTYTRSPYWHTPSVWNDNTGEWNWLDDVYIGGGKFNLEFQVPLDYSDDSDLSLVYGGISAYASEEHIISGFSQVFDEDVAVLDVELPVVVYFGDNNLNVKVANVGKTVTDATIEVYIAKGNDRYDFDESSELKESRVITLGAEEVREEMFNVPFEGESVNITVEINSAGDMNANNNKINVVRRVYMNIDAAVEMDVGGYFIVNETGKVELDIRNKGVEHLYNVNYSLELKKSGLFEGEYELVESGMIDKINKGRKVNKEIEIVFDEAEYYVFRAIVNVRGDQNPDNNVDYWSNEVRLRGADLAGSTEMGNLIVGEASDILVRFSNYGVEQTQDGVVELYYQEGDCDGEGCDNLTLIESTEISLGPDEYGERFFEFIPGEAGEITFILILNASNEIDFRNNIDYHSVTVKERGPDVTVRWNWDEELRLVKGEEANLTWVVENIGTETAEDINLSLYLVLYDDLGVGGEGDSIAPQPVGGSPVGSSGSKKLDNRIYQFIGSKIIDTIWEGGTSLINISFTPEERGSIEFMANLSLEGDIYLGNNYENYGGIVLNNGLDVAINRVHSSEFVLDRQSFIRVFLSNVGNVAVDNVNVSLYMDDVFILDETIGNIDSGLYGAVNLDFTPTVHGEMTFKIVAELEGDLNLSDNVWEINKSVYKPKEVNITLTDSDGDNVSRVLFTEIFESSVNEKHTLIEVLEGNEHLGIGNIFGEAQAVMIGFEGLNLSEEESIISEYYGSLEQNGAIYYSVFANELSFDYISLVVAAGMNIAYAEGLGIDTNALENYSLVYCEDFDFSSQNCIGEWNDFEDFHFNQHEEGFYFEMNQKGGGEIILIEAFGLSYLTASSWNTTNLSGITGDEFDNLVIETNSGRITFNETVNISRIRDNVTILRDNVDIDLYGIGINTDNVPELDNISAQILFKNIDFRNPIVTYNNNDSCSDSVCTKILHNSTARFVLVDITGFSEFGVVEGSYCGDGSCNSGESCSDCTADCGVCVGGGTPGGGGGSSRRCTPDWECVYGPCIDGVKNLVCNDLNHCGTTRGKPIDQKICFVEADCVDNDKDGYGVGIDCLGADLDDNDPGITTVSRQELSVEQEVVVVEPGISTIKKSENKFLKYVYYSVSALIVVLTLALITLYSLKQIEVWGAHKSVDKAKEFIKKARKGKYSDEKIEKMFIKGGWKKEDVDSILDIKGKGRD
jgi:hypothetical protein